MENVWAKCQIFRFAWIFLPLWEYVFGLLMNKKKIWINLFVGHFKMFYQLTKKINLQNYCNDKVIVTFGLNSNKLVKQTCLHYFCMFSVCSTTLWKYCTNKSSYSEHMHLSCLCVCARDFFRLFDGNSGISIVIAFWWWSPQHIPESGEQLEIQMNVCVCCLWQELSIGGE